MQKMYRKGKWAIDIDTVNLKFGYYNVDGKRCIFVGIIHIYYYGKYKPK